jgi:hypothetical protein
LHDEYRLRQNSAGINFGSVADQPSDSLGTVNNADLIQDDGAARDADNHNSGAYEGFSQPILLGNDIRSRYVGSLTGILSWFRARY